MTARKRNTGKNVLFRMGSNLRDARLVRGQSQRQVGQALQMSENYVGQIERGKRFVSIGVLARMCTYLGLDISHAFAPRPKKGVDGVPVTRRQALLAELNEYPVRNIRQVVELLRDVQSLPGLGEGGINQAAIGSSGSPASA